MRIPSKVAYVLFGVLISMILLTSMAPRHRTGRYHLLEYPYQIVKLDTESGNIEILNLRKDVVDDARVPYNIIKVDCKNATFKKEMFREE